jgi:hypothetical protein
MIQVRKRKAADDAAPLWFWDLIDDEGEVIAEGLKGYSRRGACVKGALRAKAIMTKAGIVEHLA